MKLDPNIDAPVLKGGSGSHDLFYQEVMHGLNSSPKKLPSKYFYDPTGDHLFQSIMAMPEYYLTKCELDIFSNKTTELANAITLGNEPFDLIELGSGDAIKSSYLLKQLVKQGVDFTYMPIDISGNILSVLDKNLKEEIPELNITCLKGEYIDMLEKAVSLSSHRKVVLFLGSNIGNMEVKEAYVFCEQLNQELKTGDILIIGFDLKKNPHIILEAYNDKTGNTAAFNINLLARINRELNADFVLENYQHYQTYDPVSGACRSFLISLKKQDISIGGHTLSFAENEPIHMEISQKFSAVEIELLARRTGFELLRKVADSQNWFLDAVWQVK